MTDYFVIIQSAHATSIHCTNDSKSVHRMSLKVATGQEIGVEVGNEVVRSGMKLPYYQKSQTTLAVS